MLHLLMKPEQKVRIMTPEQIQNVLYLHDLWLKNPSKGKRANFAEASLSGADLRGANLEIADMLGADLQGANLSGANMLGTYMYKVNLRDAKLCGANLSSTDLRESDFTGADFTEANLRRCDLRNAKFTMELKDTLNLHDTYYTTLQFPFLALNISFLKAVKSLSRT